VIPQTQDATASCNDQITTETLKKQKPAFGSLLVDWMALVSLILNQSRQVARRGLGFSRAMSADSESSLDNAIEQPILSEEERKLFAEHQRFITQARFSGTEAGKRLSEIRDRKLYRERFRTFEGFCRTRWNLSKRRAQKLIEEAEVLNQPSR
jgi:hypothetical protein